MDGYSASPDDTDEFVRDLPGVARVVGAVVAYGTHHLDEMTLAMSTRLEAALPNYGASRSRASLDEVQSSIRRTAETLLRCLETGRPPDRQDLVSFTLMGTQRALEGVAREDVFAALRLCRRVGFSFLLQADLVGEREASTVLEATVVISDVLDDCLGVVEKAVEEGYVEAGGQLALQGHSGGNALIANRLLRGDWRLEEELRLDAERRGHRLGRLHGLLLVVDGPKSTDTTLAEALRRFVADLPCTCLPGTVHWSPLPHIPIVVSVKAAKSWEDLTRRARDVASPLEAAAVRHGLIVVTSAPTESLERLPVTYRRAHGSLGFLAAARSEPGVVSSRRMEMFSLVAGDGQDIGRLTRWVNEVLGPLDRHPKAELMRAIIQAYYRSSGRWTGVGELTGLHRSTFMPYVRLIEELTGLHFDRSADVHELLTAYRLGEFLRDQFEKLESLDRPG